MPTILFTKEECEQWKKNKKVNPRTNRKINPEAKQGVYKKLAEQCEQIEVKKKSPSSSDQRTIIQKYCDCLMHVRPKRYPYGICTASVLMRHKVKHPKYCDYDFTKYTDEELVAFAKELNERKNIPLGLKSPQSKSRAEIMKTLEEYTKKRRQKKTTPPPKHAKSPSE